MVWSIEGYINIYTVIQNKLIIVPISNGAYRLGSYILSICYGGPSQNTLAEALNKSVRTYTKILKRANRQWHYI